MTYAHSRVVIFVAGRQTKTVKLEFAKVLSRKNLMQQFVNAKMNGLLKLEAG
jgi:hypothetical protein